MGPMKRNITEVANDHGVHGKCVTPAEIWSNRAAGGKKEYLTCLPQGTDILFVSFLSGSQALYCLACSHRKLAKYVCYVDRLNNLQKGRLKALARHFKSYSLNGARNHDQHICNGPAKHTARELPLLKKLHFSGQMEWNSGLLRLFLNSILLTPGTACVNMPTLECLDLSETVMTSVALHLLLEKIAKRPHLHTLVLPDMRETAAYGTANFVRSIPFIRGLGNRHGVGLHYLREIIDELRLGEHHHEGLLQPAPLEKLDFACRRGEVKLGQYRVGCRTLLDMVKLLGARALFPRLRVLRLDCPPLDFKGLYRDVSITLCKNAGPYFMRGAVAGLEELCLRNTENMGMTASDLIGMTKAMARGPVANFKAMQVLRLHGFVSGEFHPALALVTAFTGMRNPRDGRWHSLRILDLTNNLLGDIALETLAEGIGKGVFGPALQELDLSLSQGVRRTQQTTIGPAGIRALVMALKARGDAGEEICLKRLHLGGQEIGDEGVAELARGWCLRGFCCWKALEEVKLNENGITDEGFWRLMAGLTPCVEEEKEESEEEDPPTSLLRGRWPVLRRLVLERNLIMGGEDLCKRVRSFFACQMLDARPTALPLKRLNLARNPLTAKGLGTFLSCLGPSLHELKLGGNTNKSSYNNAMLRELWRPVCDDFEWKNLARLWDVRRLDLRKLEMSREVVEELARVLQEGRQLTRLSQLELSLADIRKGRDVAVIVNDLKIARGPRLVWDVLTINYQTWIDLREP